MNFHSVEQENIEYMNRFLVFLEQRQGVVKQASIEAWKSVQELAARSGGAVISALLPGPADTSRLEELMGGDGVVCHADDEAFRLYTPEGYVHLVMERMAGEGCSALFFADSALARDLAPRLSVRLRASLLSGRLSLSAAGEVAGCTRHVYAASAEATFVPARPISITLLSSGSRASSAIPGGTITIKPHALCGASVDGFSQLAHRIVMRRDARDVAEAGIVVAGGRGMGSEKGFALLDELAELLGGAVGASRAAVDAGWRPHASQIGQTGKSVAPALYIACGISGAIQHLAGIGSAGMVVAINTDMHAPVFDVADYGIVGDVGQVLPRLNDAVREFLKKK